MRTPWMVDIHTHLFPEWVRKNRKEYAGRDSVFSEIYGDERAKMVTAEETVAAMDEQLVALSVVFGFPWEDQGLNREHNDYTLQAGARFPDRLVPFACVNPLAPGAPEEVERCIARGAKGVGEIAFYDRVIDEGVIKALEPIMGVLKEACLPFLIHTNEPVGHHYPGKSMKNLTEIERLIRRFPDNTIILAHWGGGVLFFELMKEIKALFKHVYYDTAASPYLYQPEIFKRAEDILGKGKILLGTDFPLISPGRYLRQIESVIGDEQTVRAICRENALTVLGRVPPEK